MTALDIALKKHHLDIVPYLLSLDPLASTNDLARPRNIEKTCLNLCSSHLVNFHGVDGFPITMGELCMRGIISHTNGVSLFKEIFTNGTPEAQYYALCGISVLAPDQFDPFADSFLAKKPSFRFGSDLMSGDDAEHFVKSLKNRSFEKSLLTD